MNPTADDMLDWIQANPDVEIKSPRPESHPRAFQPVWVVDPTSSVVEGRSRDLRTAIKEAMRLRP